MNQGTNRTLVIVESPAKARTIQKFLGKTATVKASMGHVRDLPKSKFGVDVEAGFEPEYVVIKGKTGILKELKDEARRSSRVYLATDPDREGEAISWHLMTLLGLDPDERCRVEFPEITREVVTRAMANPREIDWKLVYAQQARRVLDRLVGYKLSPLLWKKVRRGLSAGRVQSVAVRMICDREQAIKSFQPQEYWTISASFAKPGDEKTFQAKLVLRGKEKVEIPDKAHAEAILEDLAGAAYVVLQVAKKERRRKPPLPFTTSTLQQEASRRLGFSVKKTMMVAQRLYEGLDIGPEGSVGLITYMRTDSTRISSEARGQAVSYIAERYGQQYVGPGEDASGSASDEKASKKKNKKVEFVQGAHEAIRPTKVARLPDQIKKFISPDEYKLYKLIWERFLASQMASAVFEVTTVDIEARKGDPGSEPGAVDRGVGGSAGEFQGYIFRATGRVMLFEGYLAVYGDLPKEKEQGDEGSDAEADAVLPPLAEGETLALLSLDPKQHFTEPPPRYSEATLVKALEENGIGRPSTYAPTIDLIQRRGYVDKEGKWLKPTDLGVVVVEFLRSHFPEIIDLEFTAQMESQLDRVERGELDWREVLTKFYGPFTQNLKQVEENVGRVRLPAEPTEEKCELCGAPMVVRTGRYGRFLACSRFPDCKGSRPIRKEAGVACPLCGHPVVERRTKGGRKFFGCSGYPACTFTTWYQPVSGSKCPKCGWFLVRRAKKGARGQNGMACANPDCDYVANNDEY